MANYRDNYKCKQVQQFLDGEVPNLLIHGKSGTGKTMALEYIKREFKKKMSGMSSRRLDEEPRDSVLMTDAITYVDTMWRNLNDYEGDSKIFGKYKNVSLLLLDDLGVELQNDRSITYLFMLLNNRTKPIVISTNLTDEEILIRYGERIHSRLIGRFLFVEFKGDNWRDINAKMEEASFV